MDRSKPISCKEGAGPAKGQAKAQGAKLGQGAGRVNAGAGPSGLCRGGGSGGQGVAAHSTSTVRTFPPGVKAGQAQRVPAKGPTVAGAGGVGGGPRPKPNPNTLPRTQPPHHGENAQAVDAGHPGPQGEGGTAGGERVLTKRQRRRENARAKARVCFSQTGATATQVAQTGQTNSGQAKRAL